jgi:predicted component of type VI protein secretion system
MSDAPASSRLHTYFVVKEPDAPDRILVFDTQEVSIGRAKESDVQAKYPEVSRRHALLSRDGKKSSVQNLSTSSQTLVNGCAAQSHTLKDRDVILIAEIELTYFESRDNPAKLGLKLEYASQLKEFGPASMQGANAEATILGIADAGEEDDVGGDSFKVRPPGDFDLHGLEAETTAPRDLDAELDGFGLDDLHVPDSTASPLSSDQPSAVDPEPLPSLSAAGVGSGEGDEVWTLKEADAVPAKTAQTLSLHLEIDGLTGELQTVVENLLGKVLSLPPLRIRIKGDDLS